MSVQPEMPRSGPDLSSGVTTVSFTPSEKAAIPLWRNYSSGAHDNQTVGAFGRVQPANQAARQAVHKARAYIQEECNTYHHQFLFVKAPSPLLEVSREDASDSDSDIDQDTDIMSTSRSSFESQSQCLDISFTLSFDMLPAHHSWRIGKGSSKAPQDRGVDLLLVRPGEKEARNFAVVHALIQINPDSGAAVLRAVSKKPIWYYSGNEEIKLQAPAQRVLYEPTNRFRIGELEFKVTFEVSNANVAEFIQIRNQYLKTVWTGDPPHPNLHPIPKPTHRRLGSVIIHSSLNSGSFGWVYAGVDSSNGQPLAVKELRIPRMNSMWLVQKEVAVARRFTKVGATYLILSASNVDHRDVADCWKPFRSGVSTMKTGHAG